MVTVGGITKVMARPNTKATSSALIRTLLRRAGNGLTVTNNRLHPNIIRHLSGRADNIVIFTGASLTCRTVIRGFTRHRVRGRCLTLISGTPSLLTKAVGTPVSHRPGGHIGVTIHRSNGRT